MGFVKGQPKVPGSGRKKGTRDKKVVAMEKATEDGGLMPLEVMLNNMRWGMEQALAISEKKPEEITDDDKMQIGFLRKFAQDAAKDAAPYLHSRLALVDPFARKGDDPDKLDAYDAMDWIERAKEVAFVFTKAEQQLTITARETVRHDH